MKKILYIFLAAIFFLNCTPKVTKQIVEDTVDFRSVAPAPKPAPEITFGDTKLSTLPNGMKLIIVENTKVPKVTMRLYLDKEPIIEGKHAGSAEMMGEMLSKGSKTRNKEDLDEAIDFLGANFNTNKKGFYISGLSKHADKMLELAADAVLHPAWNEGEFEKIKTQKLSELATVKDDPNGMSQNAVSFINYGLNNPYGQIVTEESCKNTGINDCIESYNYYFNPADSYLVFVGIFTFGKSSAI